MQSLKNLDKTFVISKKNRDTKNLYSLFDVICMKTESLSIKLLLRYQIAVINDHYLDFYLGRSTLYMAVRF